MAESVFSLTKPRDLDDYLDRCARFRPSLNVSRTRETALASIKSLQSTSDGAVLERRWYESLKRGEPDYTVYDDDFFIGDIWTCWVLFSRKYLLSLRSPKSLPYGGSISNLFRPFIKCIADLGCGFGYSTAGLKEIFPDADVYGTNLKDTCQWHVASEIGQERDFTLVPNIRAIGKRVDLIFASEYFEHIQNPVEHLIDIINVSSPQIFIFANAFRSPAVGHFDIYRHESKDIPGSSIGRLFSKTLRDRKYKPVKTTLWNNRPNIWVKY